MLNVATFSSTPVGFSGSSGCSGVASNVLAVATFEAADSPASLTAVTVKLYSLAAVKPVTVYVVSVTLAIESVP